MSLPCKSERRRLSHDQFELVRVTHHPAIYELSADELHALKLRLREQRNKARVCFVVQEKRALVEDRFLRLTAGALQHELRQFLAA